MIETEALRWYIRIMEIVTVFLGSLMASYAFRAYMRGHGRTFLLSGVGFAMITTSSLIEDILHEIGKYALLEAQIVRATLDVIGFLLLVYSLTKSK